MAATAEGVFSVAGSVSCAFGVLSDECVPVVLFADDSAAVFAVACAVAGGLSTRDLLTDTRGAPFESAFEDVDRDGARFDRVSLSLSPVVLVESVESPTLLSGLSVGFCVEPVLDQLPALLSVVPSEEAAVAVAALVDVDCSVCGEADWS